MKRNFAGKLMALIAVCALMATMLVPTIAFADETYGKPILETVFKSDKLTEWAAAGGAYTNQDDGSILMNGYGDAFPIADKNTTVGMSYTVEKNNASDTDENYAQSLSNFQVCLRKTDWNGNTTPNEIFAGFIVVRNGDGRMKVQFAGGNNSNGESYDQITSSESNNFIFFSGETCESEVKNVSVTYANGVLYVSGSSVTNEPFNITCDISSWWGSDVPVKLGFRTWCGTGNIVPVKLKNVSISLVPEFEKAESKKILYKTSGVNADDNSAQSDNFVVDVTMKDSSTNRSLDSRLYVHFYTEDGKDDVRYRIIGDGRLESFIVNKGGNGMPDDTHNYYKIDGLHINENTGTFRLIYTLKNGVLNVSSVVNGKSYDADAVEGIFDANKKYTVKIWDQAPANNTVTFENFEVYEPLGVSVDDVKLEVKTAENAYAPTSYIAGGADYKVTITATGTDGKLIGALYGNGLLMNVTPMDVTASTEFNFTIPQGTENPVIKFFRWKNINGDLAPYLEPITFTVQP